MAAENERDCGLPDPGMIANETGAGTGMRARESWEMDRAYPSILPKMPVNCLFNPAEIPLSKAVWASTAGRILTLLWRPRHLCSDRWWERATPIADRIEMKRPKTRGKLYSCFVPDISHTDFTSTDVFEFCAQALDYFTGEKGVTYQIGGDVLTVQMAKYLDDNVEIRTELAGMWSCFTCNYFGPECVDDDQCPVCGTHAGDGFGMAENDPRYRKDAE